MVSTHSHPKVAACFDCIIDCIIVCFNTQPPEGGCGCKCNVGRQCKLVSTHSHPKVAAHRLNRNLIFFAVSTHSHPKVAAEEQLSKVNTDLVSTHSHPKVAANTSIDNKPIFSVSTHSHPKVAAKQDYINVMYLLFQHTATRRWLQFSLFKSSFVWLFQHTATRRWLREKDFDVYIYDSVVSTHSHPKVAAYFLRAEKHGEKSFNTQPPEGGCKRTCVIHKVALGFNTQPPEGGCKITKSWQYLRLGFNTQPPEGGCERNNLQTLQYNLVSTHSHPKVAAQAYLLHRPLHCGFNTQPPEGGCKHLIALNQDR